MGRSTTHDQADLLAAALLALPRRRFAGAALLVVILTGAVITHLANQDPLSESVSAPLHLALVAAVALATRPPLTTLRRSTPVH